MTQFRRIPEATRRADGLGIDLRDRRMVDLVARLYYGRQAWRVEAVGLDPQDVLQDVYASIMRRNLGANPYDPRKAAPVTWLWLVIRSVTTNAVDAARKRRADGHEELLGIGEDAATWEHDADGRRVKEGQ